MSKKIERAIDNLVAVHPSTSNSGSCDIPLVLDSAEAKALQRIAALENGEPVNWVIIEPDELVDIQTVRKRIQERGYTVST